jgi:hypothetical protein
MDVLVLRTITVAAKVSDGTKMPMFGPGVCIIRVA